MTVLESLGGPIAASVSSSPAEAVIMPGHPAGLPAWGEAEGTTLICRQVQDVTHDVKTFLFEAEEPALFLHQPGQFVTLLLQIEGRAVSRCYTISSPPTRPRLQGITVKRQPGALVSNWLHDTMAPDSASRPKAPTASSRLPGTRRRSTCSCPAGAGSPRSCP